MELPDVLPNETINDYIKRLIVEKVIKPTDLKSAIAKYNSK